MSEHLQCMYAHIFFARGGCPSFGTPAHIQYYYNLSTLSIKGLNISD